MDTKLKFDIALVYLNTSSLKRWVHKKHRNVAFAMTTIYSIYGFFKAKNAKNRDYTQQSQIMFTVLTNSVKTVQK